MVAQHRWVVPVSVDETNRMPLEPCTSFQLDLATTTRDFRGRHGVSSATKSNADDAGAWSSCGDRQSTESHRERIALVPVIVRCARAERPYLLRGLLTESLCAGVPILIRMATRRLLLRAGALTSGHCTEKVKNEPVLYWCSSRCRAGIHTHPSLRGFGLIRSPGSRSRGPYTQRSVLLMPSSRKRASKTRPPTTIGGL